jgi:hypothetical protein
LQWFIICYFLILACKQTEVVVKTDVSNLTPSSNPDTVGNVIPGVGGKDNPWTPSPEDTKPSLTVNLPEVNGVPAGEYPIMKVDLTPVGDAGTITVTILDKDNNPVFEVGNSYGTRHIYCNSQRDQHFMSYRHSVFNICNNVQNTVI